MTRPQKILLITLSVLLIGAVILIATLFKRRASDSEKLKADKEKLVIMDSLSASERRTRDALVALGTEKDNRISDLKYNDSITNVHFLQNQIIYKQLNAELKNIPANIARIAHNDDSIRAAFSRD